MLNYYVFEIDDYSIYLYFFYEEVQKGLEPLLEAKNKGVPIGGPYSVFKHKPHCGSGQKHLHIYKKQNQIFALNQDGSAHDQSHRIQIPNKVAKGITTYFPDINLPDNNFIEAVDSPVHYAFLMECEIV